MDYQTLVLVPIPMGAGRHRSTNQEQRISCKVGGGAGRAFYGFLNVTLQRFPSNCWSDTTFPSTKSIKKQWINLVREMRLFFLT